MPINPDPQAQDRELSRIFQTWHEGYGDRVRVRQICLTRIGLGKTWKAIASMNEPYSVMTLRASKSYIEASRLRNTFNSSDVKTWHDVLPRDVPPKDVL